MFCHARRSESLPFVSAMRLIRNLNELREPLRSAVTIGNFDGVHLAHQALLRGVVDEGRKLGATATAVTFDPHPIRLLAPERAPKLLTPLAKKARLIERLGVELLVVIPFTRELAALSPEDFVRTFLRGQLRAVAVHVGPNFRFGHRQAGDIQLLAELAQREGFRLHVLPAVTVRGQQVSSTRIRELLASGRVHTAARLLGRPFSVSGAIVSGSGIGHRETVPTLNLAPVEEQLPQNGVYVTRTRLGSQFHESVTNVGHKPTFGEHRLTVECFLLNFRGEIHESEMEVEFLFRLRDEMKFPDATALKAQILKDARRSVQYFRLIKLFQAAGIKS